MDNVMDLSAFQLVDAISDTDMMRSSNREQQQQQQQQTNQQQQLQQNIQDDIELLLHQSNTNSYLAYPKSNNSPHYRTTQAECYDQQEVLNNTNSKCTYHSCSFYCSSPNLSHI